jgi:hypothetical protein
MAITNTTVQLKKSGSSGNTPSSLNFGELALNYADGKLIYKAANGTIVQFSSGGGGSSYSFATINSNSSLILATSSTDTLTIAPGNNVTISTDTVAKKITINAIIEPAFSQANTATVLAQAAFDAANTGGGGGTIDQYARDTTNTTTVLAQASFDSANVINGVDVSQNNRMTIIEATDVSQNVRLDYSNTAITIIRGTDIGQNNRMTIIENTDVSQNVRLDYSNSAITIVQGVNVSQNARMTIIEGTNASQNVRLDYSNSAITIIQGVDVGQNTAIAATDGKMQSAYNTANTGYNFVNTGGTVTGNVTFANDVTVTGNLSILGNTTTIQTSQLDIGDSLIYLANNNYVSDVVDIGIIGHYNPGSSNAHTGIFRDPVRKEWIFFQGYIPEVQSNNIIDTNDASFAYANVYSNWFKGNIIATTARVNGIDIYNYSNSAFAQANNAVANIGPIVTVNSTARLYVANTTESTSTSTGALTISGGVGVSGNVYSSNVFVQRDVVAGIQDGSPLGGATNPILAAIGNANNYIQNYAINYSTGRFASADWAAYPSNGLDTSGWIDMGITGPNYSQPGHNTTGPNEGYILMSAPAGSGTSGNLVFATDITGTYNSIEMYANGFNQTKNTAQLIITSQANSISNTTGTVQVRGGLGVTGNAYSNSVYTTTSTGAIYTDNLRYAANGSPWALGGGGGGGGATLSDGTVTNANYYIPFSSATSGSWTTAYINSSILYFNPSTGTLNSTTFNSLSDKNKKEKIKTINSALKKTTQLRGVTYEWIETQQPGLGVIAQEVEKVIPELVSTDANGAKTVSYGNMVGLLIEAIKEQQKTIEEQGKRIKALENK